MKACIFDIDGTLLRIPNMGRLAYERAFAQTFEREIKIPPEFFAGATDFKLLEDLMGKNVGVDDRMRFAIHLEKALKDSIHEAQAVVFPGVFELLAALGEDKNVVLGIATGNLSTTARLKLSRARIPEVFSFGGYGDDSDLREEIILHAIRQAEQTHQKTLDHIVYVADTPADIHAAKKAGVRILSVATGRFSEDELREHQPDICMKDLSDLRTVLDVIR